MIKIRLEFLSWLSEIVENPGPNNSRIVDLEVHQDTAVKELFMQMAFKNPAFERSVFDVNLQKLNEKVCVLYNGRQIELENGLATQLKDQDHLVFVPFIQGG